MQRAPELEALLKSDDSIIADRSMRRNQLFAGTLLILFGLCAGYFVLVNRKPPERDMLAGDEEFTTTTFRPPSFVRDGGAQPESAKPEVVELSPPPPPTPAPSQDTDDVTEFDVRPPAPTVAPPSPNAAEPPKETFPQRLRSKLIVYDETAKNDNATGLLGGAEGRASVAGDDRASKFLAAAADLGERSAQARKIERIDALVPEGTLIPGVLETAIVSDLPGQIRAIVSDDVYSFDGRRVLIPSGTRLIGEYQSEIVRGQRRIFVVWTRMLRDDGVSVRLDSIGADKLGRAGLAGHVDNKFRERFGSAILLSIIGGVSSYLSGHGNRAAPDSNDNTGRAEEIARTTIAQTFSDMANQVLGEDLRVSPTISVSQGERIFVFVRQDLDFSAIYEDPVAEALGEIRHERGLH